MKVRPACGLPGRRVRLLVGVVSICAGACSTLFDAQLREGARSASEQALEDEVLRRQAGETIDHGRDYVLRTADEAAMRIGSTAMPDVLPRPSLPNAPSAQRYARPWPVLTVERSGVLKPQLVIVSPIDGIVFLNQREIGLVQQGITRVITLERGDHVVRIEQPQAPPMRATFFIEDGERATLRWAVR